MQLRDGREEALVDAINDIDIIATLSAAKFGSRPAPMDQAEAATLLNGFAKELPAGALARGRTLLLVDNAGAVKAAYPLGSTAPRSLNDLIGDAQPLTLFADRAGVMTVRLVTGEEGIATVRSPAPPDRLPSCNRSIACSPAGRRAPSDRSRSSLRSPSSSAVSVSPMSCRRTAPVRRDEVCEKVRNRIDSALNRGRCGLWDWDVARGRIYWSDSMYDILGYERHDEFLSFGEVNTMVHPEDPDLYALADQLAAARTSLVDHEFRIRSASGDWIWLRARAELMDDADDKTRHLVGIVVDVTEQRVLEERTKRPMRACGMPSRRSRKPSFSGTPATASCFATPNSETFTSSRPRPSCPAPAMPT